jgi:hypothetical protein
MVNLFAMLPINIFRELIHNSSAYVSLDDVMT